MRQVKHVLQITVVLFFFVVAVMVLLKSYNIYVRGYQQLGGLIE